MIAAHLLRPYSLAALVAVGILCGCPGEPGLTVHVTGGFSVPEQVDTLSFTLTSGDDSWTFERAPDETPALDATVTINEGDSIRGRTEVSVVALRRGVEVASGEGSGTFATPSPVMDITLGDSLIPSDAGPDVDAGSDAGHRADGGAGSDAGKRADGGAGSDAGQRADGGAGSDAGVRDAGRLFDGGRNADAGRRHDAGGTDGGRNDAGRRDGGQPPSVDGGSMGMCEPLSEGQGACPDECTGGCDDATCIVDCSADSSCDDEAPIVCAPGWNCLVLCSGFSSCDGEADILCPDVGSCEVRCTGFTSCDGTGVMRCGDGPCLLTCPQDDDLLVFLDCGNSCACSAEGICVP